MVNLLKRWLDRQNEISELRKLIEQYREYTQKLIEFQGLQKDKASKDVDILLFALEKSKKTPGTM